MKIEVLFPEFCNLFGDAYNMVYLEKTLPEAEFIRTKFSDDVRFTEEKMNLVYMGPMTEPPFLKLSWMTFPLTAEVLLWQEPEMKGMPAVIRAAG